MLIGLSREPIRPRFDRHSIRVKRSRVDRKENLLTMILSPSGIDFACTRPSVVPVRMPPCSTGNGSNTDPGGGWLEFPATRHHIEVPATREQVRQIINPPLPANI